MGGTSLPVAAKRAAVSSPRKTAPGRLAGWVRLYRIERFGGHSWVVSIPKKVIPTSVRRSRLKRLIREAMRQTGLSPAVTETWRFVVRADPPKEIRTQEVIAAILSLVK